MRAFYRGLPKPGHALFDAEVTSGPLGGTQVRSPFFRRYLGVENVLIPPVGTDDVAGVATPRPVVILTDLLAAIPGGPGGLCEETFDERSEAPWVTATRALLERLAEKRLLTILPGDQHLNPALLDGAAATPVVLDPAALLPPERAAVAASPELQRKLASRTPLTVAEVEAVFGRVIDKEDRNFIPHCREGVVDYIPSARALLDRERDELGRDLAAARLPAPWLLPDFKTGLSCLSAPDRRGMNGNALREILLASQAGAYLEGDARRHHKLAIVGGTAHEYSVAELTRFLVDLDYSVVWLLTVTGGLGIASKRATALELCERYGAKVFPTYDWPLPAHLGPEPRGFAKLAARVRREDDEFHQAWFAEHAARLAAAKSSQDVPIIRAGHDLARSLGEVVMSVERRDTRARCFLFGDRRSVEATLGLWAAWREPGTPRRRIRALRLAGEAANVLGTVAGIRAVEQLRGVPFGFALTVALPAHALATRALAATGAQAADAGPPSGVYLVVDADDGEDADARRLREGLRAHLEGPAAAVPVVVLAREAAAARFRLGQRPGRVERIHSDLAAPLMTPMVEAVLVGMLAEAGGPIVVCGQGDRVTQAALGAGDLFIEYDGGPPAQLDRAGLAALAARVVVPRAHLLGAGASLAEQLAALGAEVHEAAQVPEGLELEPVL